MSKYTHFTKLKHLIFLNGGSPLIFLLNVMVLWEMHVGLVMTTMGGIPLCFCWMTWFLLSLHDQSWAMFC
jgi:hypothetical protein